MERKIDLNIKYVYIINKNLKMSKGKIAAQVSHVAMMLADFGKPIGRAIVLKADEEMLLTMITKIGVVYIRDAGLTEVPKESLTCVGYIDNPIYSIITRKLKLL